MKLPELRLPDAAFWWLKPVTDRIAVLERELAGTREDLEVLRGELAAANVYADPPPAHPG